MLYLVFMHPRTLISTTRNVSPNARNIIPNPSLTSIPYFTTWLSKLILICPQRLTLSLISFSHDSALAYVQKSKVVWQQHQTQSKHISNLPSSQNSAYKRQRNANNPSSPTKIQPSTLCTRLRALHPH